MIILAESVLGKLVLIELRKAGACRKGSAHVVREGGRPDPDGLLSENPQERRYLQGENQ